MDSSRPRVAIVTGASRGFGRATAQALARGDWTVIVDARSSEPLDEVVASIGADGGRVTGVVGDVNDAGHRSSLMRVAIEHDGLDLLVNNASALGPSPQPALGEYPLPILREVYETNVLSPLALAQEAMPLLRSAAGILVNVSSDAATGAYEGWGGYGSSKAALDQLSNVLGAEEPALSVYAFDPGDMNTQMHQEAYPGEDISDRPDPEERVPALLTLIESRPPSGRYTADDLLGAS